MSVAGASESDDEVEWTTGDLTGAGRDYVRVFFIIPHAYGAFVRMRGKILKQAGVVTVTLKQFVNGLDCNNVLVVAVIARVMGGPRNLFRILIVSHVMILIRLGLS